MLPQIIDLFLIDWPSKTLNKTIRYRNCIHQEKHVTRHGFDLLLVEKIPTSRHAIDLKPCRLCAHKLSDFYVDYSTIFSLGAKANKNLVFFKMPKTLSRFIVQNCNYFLLCISKH